jgi:hypothetical protein
LWAFYFKVVLIVCRSYFQPHMISNQSMAVHGQVMRCNFKRVISSSNPKIFDLNSDWYILMGNGPISGGKIWIICLEKKCNCEVVYCQCWFLILTPSIIVCQSLTLCWAVWYIDMRMWVCSLYYTVKSSLMFIPVPYLCLLEEWL